MSVWIQQPAAAWVSAHTGAGLDLLRAAIAERLDLEKLVRRIEVAPADGRLRAQLYEMGAVLAEEALPDGGWLLEVTLSRSRWARLFPDLAPAAGAGDAKRGSPETVGH